MEKQKVKEAILPYLNNLLSIFNKRTQNKYLLVMLRTTLFFCLFFAQSFWVTAQKSVIIRGYITHTEDYCNGAAPTPEMEAALATEKPESGKIIYVKIGTTNKYTNTLVKKIKTNANGRFELSLKPGITYYFVEEWKANVFKAPKNTAELTWDIACLRKRYANPDFVLKTKGSNNPEVHINYHKPCDFRPYCGDFSGPLPP
jgi:hypothetical protein